MFSSTAARGLTYYFQADDEAIGKSLRDAGEFSRVESDYISDCLKSFPQGGTVIDVGANIGAVSLPVARARPDVQFLCLEPHLPTYQALSTNILVNGLSNVRALPWFAAASTGYAPFPYMEKKDDRNYGGISVVTSAPKNVRTIAAKLDDLDLSDVAFVKIDTEGYDVEVLKGASAIWRQGKAVVLFETGNEHLVRHGFDLMTGFGYRCHWLFSPFLLPDNEKGFVVDIDNWTGDCNIVATPPGFAEPWGWPVIEDSAKSWRLHDNDFAAVIQRRYRPVNAS